MRRRIVTGTLGLVLALVWAMAFLYQRHNVDFWMSISLADAPIALRVSSLWSMLQVWIPLALGLPVAAISVALMFGDMRWRGGLRLAVGASAVLSAGVLVIYAAVSASRVGAGGPVFLPNASINYELLAAAVTLVLQTALLILLQASGRDDAGETSMSSVVSDARQTPSKAPRPLGGDPQLATTPTR